MKLSVKDIIIIALFLIAIGSFWYFQNELNNAYEVKFKLLDSRIKRIDSLNLSIKKKLEILDKKSKLQEKKIKRFTYKLRKYEKKTDVNTINSLRIDSIRAILTQ